LRRGDPGRGGRIGGTKKRRKKAALEIQLVGRRDPRRYEGFKSKNCRHYHKGRRFSTVTAARVGEKSPVRTLYRKKSKRKKGPTNERPFSMGPPRHGGNKVDDNGGTGGWFKLKKTCDFRNAQRQTPRNLGEKKIIDHVKNPQALTSR